MISKEDYRQLVNLWMGSDKSPDAAAISYGLTDNHISLPATVLSEPTP